jgi:DNA-binding GntR family transcriptional regulator
MSRSNLKLSPVARTELGTAAADKLRRLIVSGELAPGERLVENEIASRLQISRTPVRDALFCLQGEGLATPRGKKGLEVSGLSAQEIDQIYPLIAALEKTALLACPPFSTAKISRLRSINSRFSGVVGEAEKLIGLDRDWHTALLEQTENRMALPILARLGLLAERYERAYFDADANNRSSVRQHEEIIVHLEKDEIPRAADLVERHWLQSREAIYAAIS